MKDLSELLRQCANVCDRAEIEISSLEKDPGDDETALAAADMRVDIEAVRPMMEATPMLREALKLAERNIASRIHMLPLTTPWEDRKALETEHSIYKAALEGL